MTAPKLTKPQIALLREAATSGGARAVEWYPPAKKLRTLGLIEWRSVGFSDYWRITQAGRDALEGVGG